jgi:hypothetical protein
MMKTLRMASVLLAGVVLAANTWAKLPAPTPEAQAKAAEAAAKAAWNGKVDNYKLCQSQDRVAAHYRKTSGKAGGTGAPCTDPGPFTYTPPAPKS